MSTASVSIVMESDSVVLERGELRVEIELQPFSMTIRRRGRRLMRAAGAWVAQGTVHDHFIQFTEGVVAREELAPPERAGRSSSPGLTPASTSAWCSTVAVARDCA